MTTDLSTRHGFLTALHDLLAPKVYLEIGVQHGTSLDLAVRAELAIGIDPNPLVSATGNQWIIQATSDRFFEEYPSFTTAAGMKYTAGRHAPAPTRGAMPPRIDLAFIDGMHLVEYALRDFANIEQYCHPGSVVVFDDVLPRNQHEARRLEPGEPVLGDWTGDVWKVHQLLSARAASWLAADLGQEAQPDPLNLTLVNTQPTGLLVVTGFNPIARPTPDWVDRLEPWVARPAEVPEQVLNRTDAFSPLPALQRIVQQIKR